MVARSSTAGRTFECLGQRPAGVWGVGTLQGARWEPAKRRFERTRRETRKKYADCNLHALQYREIREQELAERMAESTRRALDASLRPSLRARMARRLFALTVAANRKETWNVVWETLEAKRRL
jgi:hypothetical protein